jgi:hypothetical protein
MILNPPSIDIYHYDIPSISFVKLFIWTPYALESKKTPLECPQELAKKPLILSENFTNFKIGEFPY